MFETGKSPNKQTIAMGELIRKAREEAGLTQDQLAEMIYRKRLAVSEMENGKVEISAWTLPLLSSALKKPITYFFPPLLRGLIDPNQMTPEEEELIYYFRQIWNEDIQHIAIKQIQILGEFDPTETLMRAYDLAKEKSEFLKQVKEKKEKRSNSTK